MHVKKNRTLHFSILIFSILFASKGVSAASCADALQSVFGNEGGYQNSKQDGGNWSSKKVGVGKLCGGTKYGIACAYSPGVDIKNLTKERAAKIYEGRECRQIRMSELNGQIVPTLLLDLAVNMGVEMAVKLLGTSINLLSSNDKQIKFNDEMTDEMVAWYNANTKDRQGLLLLYATITLTAIDRYAYIVESNKKQSVWLLGWIRRVIPNEIEAIRPNKNPE